MTPSLILSHLSLLPPFITMNKGCITLFLLQFLFEEQGGGFMKRSQDRSSRQEPGRQKLNIAPFKNKQLSHVCFTAVFRVTQGAMQRTAYNSPHTLLTMRVSTIFFLKKKRREFLRASPNQINTVQYLPASVRLHLFVTE